MKKECTKDISPMGVMARWGKPEVSMIIQLLEYKQPVSAMVGGVQNGCHPIINAVL